MRKQRVVVVGNGMVGHRFVELACEHKDRFEITVIGGEQRPAYDRVHLSQYFAGKSADDLALATESGYQQIGVEAVFGDPVKEIDRTANTLTTVGGQTIRYDKLVLATGSFPFVPPIPGNDREHCLTYRTIDDLERIEASASTSKVGVVVGGGLLGLECANALHQLGLETHVVEFAPGLMGVQLDGGGSKMLRKQIEALGVSVHTGKATQTIESGSTNRLRMEFADGEHLETDMIVFSAGIRPYDQLARDCGLEVGERGGIVIDDQCRTSDAKVFAIGECALWRGRILGLVSPGYKMAEVAAEALCEEDVSFAGADMSTKLKLLGVHVGSIGDAHGREPDCMRFSFSDPKRKIYKSVATSNDGTRLLGAVLVGDTDDYDTLLQCHLNGLPLPAAPEELVLPSDSNGLTFDPLSLPPSALICACNSVSKQQISNAIQSGCTELKAIQQSTKAGTGCGGCVGMLEAMLAHSSQEGDDPATKSTDPSAATLLARTG
ncbi:MAG: FAD-dependent oxidoreductase [Pseudomonadota bacterium]